MHELQEFEPIESLNKEWDIIVIGTGMGGASIGFELARLGKNVLFLEKGNFLDTNIASSLMTNKGYSSIKDPELRLAMGHWPYPLVGRSSFGELDFFAPLGCGAGGTSLLYAAALERFHPIDFTPKQNFPNIHDSNLPKSWPITYEELVPYYEYAEKLYCVHGTNDPLTSIQSKLSTPPPMTPRDQELMQSFRKMGLNPYHLHIGMRFFEGCTGCGGVFCKKGCKADACNVCLLPALEHHGAKILTNCNVEEITFKESHLTSVRCSWRGREIKLRASIFILAAGGYMTPGILMRSNNLANRSGMVGRNLMFHASDLFALCPRKYKSSAGMSKTIAINDFYFKNGIKLGGFQSLGIDLNVGLIIGYFRDQIKRDPQWWRPLLRPIYHPLAYASWLYFKNAALFASIIEDLPYHNNRIVYDPSTKSGIRFEYTYTDDLRQRVMLFRNELKKNLPLLKPMLLSSENNINYGHVCGTCRFGDDPKLNVLDRNNKAHDIDNLYIVDSSFFPSSGGTNPSLTIAANALRVANIIHSQH